MRCFHWEYFVLNINIENAKPERGKTVSMARGHAWKPDKNTGSLSGSFPFVDYKVELFPAEKGLVPFRTSDVSQVDKEEVFMPIVCIWGTTPM